MYAIHFIRCLNRSFSSKLKTVVSLKCLQRNFKAKQPSSFDLKNQLKSDVVLFQHENTKHFILVNVLAAVQCTFWTYLGFFLFRSLDNPSLKFEKSKVWATILEKEKQFSRGLCVLSLFFGKRIQSSRYNAMGNILACLIGAFFMCHSHTGLSDRSFILVSFGGIITLIFIPGWATLFGTFLYSTQNIRKLILHKDGRFITLVTYGLPGYNTFKIPLNNVSSVQHRTKVKKYLPIKLKDKFFHYLIDVTGKFSDPKLFDFTVGVRRGF